MSATSPAPETFQLTGSETLVVTTHTAELLEVEASWDAGAKAPPPHLHPSQASGSSSTRAS